MIRSTWLRPVATACALLALLASHTSTAQLQLELTHPAFLELAHGDTAHFQCSGLALLSTADVEVSGACSQETDIAVSEEVEVFEGAEIVDGLLSLMTCAFTATDECAQEATLVVTIAVYDTIAPLLQSVPADLELEAGESLPPLPHVWAIDNCTRNPKVEYNEEREQTPTQLRVVRTWTAADDAGNTSLASQLIVQARSGASSGQPCDDVFQFNTDSLQLNSTSCGQRERVCLSAEGEFDGQLTINGEPSTSAGFCESRAVTEYDLADVNFDGSSFEVIWSLGNGLARGRINDEAELLQLVKEREAEAEWVFAEGVLSGLASARFGELTLLRTSDAQQFTAVPSQALRGAGLSVEVMEGQYEIIATTVGGCSDTLSLNVACEAAATDEITAIAGLTGSYCLALPADATAYDITYEVTEGNRLLAARPLEGKCLTFTTLRPGLATVTFEYCQAGTEVCERLQLTIDIVSRENLKPPTAASDLFAVATNGQRMFDVIVNDEIPGGATSVIVLTPTRGDTRVDAQGRIHYRAPMDWCGDDSFRYEVCNSGGCSEALVTVQVTCEDLIVFNGFSPNGDGQNDSFTVLGIENYPDNSLIVFNQYGHEVYAAEGYANTWDGTRNGTPLVDGTYYFVLSVEGRAPESGYLQIKR